MSNTDGVDELFDFTFALDLAMAPLDWLLDLFVIGGPPGPREQHVPSQSEMAPLLAGQARKLRVAELAQLERDRRAGRLDLTEFTRRYSRVAHVSPREDPARSGAYGPNARAVGDVLDKMR